MCSLSVCLAGVRACMLCCVVCAGVDRCFDGRCQCLLTLASSASILAPAHVECSCIVSGARGPSALCVNQTDRQKTKLEVVFMHTAR